MNFRQAFESREDSFQLAPLVDILFILLIFFVVTGALVAQERAQESETPIELPKTTAAIVRPREKLDIVVNITRKGQIWINNQRYSIEKLRRVLINVAQSARSAPVSVIIRADGRSQYQNVVQVIDACTAAKLRNVSFVSVNEGKSSIK